MRVRTIEDCMHKANQAWECAGCARMDGDTKDMVRWTNEAREWTERARQGGYIEGSDNES